MSKYVIKVASAKMPSSCKGRYCRIGLIEMEEEGMIPSMISDRAKGVKQIVKTWEKLFVGTTENCAYRRALAEAEKMKLYLEGK